MLLEWVPILFGSYVATGTCNNGIGSGNRSDNFGGFHPYSVADD